MRTLVFLSLLFIACNSSDQAEPTKTTESTEATDGTADTKTTTDTAVVKPPADTAVADERPVYSNQRFRDVKVQKLGGYRFEITGQAQIFEANFGWYVTDGQEEIKTGNTMTDAGAPEWGNFSFVVRIKKKRPDSKLQVVLFESSAKDGTRQYQLPVLLY
jgi:hypothetical protein